MGEKCGVDVVNRWRRLCSQLISQSALSKVNTMMGLVNLAGAVSIRDIASVLPVVALCKSPNTYNKRQLSHSLFFPFSSAMGSGVVWGSRG